MDIEHIILAFSYLGIGGLMVLNGFISFPSSQILYILCGYFISTGFLSFLPTTLIGTLGNTLGNIILYEVVRRHGLGYLERFRIFRHQDIEKVEIVFRRKGPWFLFVAKLLPAIKVFAPIPPAIGKMRRDIFIPIIFFSSLLWSWIFLAIGYFFGRGAQLWKSYGVALVVIAAVVLYTFYRYLNSPEIIRELEEEKPNDR